MILKLGVQINDFFLYLPTLAAKLFKDSFKYWTPFSTDASTTSLRSPSICSIQDLQPFGPATEKQTVPTGVNAVPPDGPAIPVVAIAKSTLRRSLHPRAIDSATSQLTTPCCSMVELETFKREHFTSVA